ncbi:MAG: N-6 DNA methylase [Gemmatimonadaceae bacterium]|nr:N-6 DNA methylase [Gemmatimonadaceae bacterium]
MLTLRHAAGLLAQASTLAHLRAVVRAMGYPSILHCSAAARRTLTVDHLVTDADLGRGTGRLRCLSAVLRPEIFPDGAATVRGPLHDPREITRRLCLTLHKRAPDRDWCVVTLDATTHVITIANLSCHGPAPRITALRVDRRRVVDSDADTLRLLATVVHDEPTLRHSRFSEILGRDALCARFYRTLEETVQQLATTASGRATETEKRELALLCTSRCLFLAFLQAKGWLDHDRQFLRRETTARLERGGRLHERFLRPLFFGSLNTPLAQRAPAARALGVLPFLNGGLFAPTPLEQRRRTVCFTDDALAELLAGVLDRFRFTAHEHSSNWSEAAVDPEMLGRAFESLMAADERHQSGTYYTPPALVETVVRDALSAALPELSPEAFNDDLSPLAFSASTREALAALRVLDPACGSGAFLVRMLEQLATLQQRGGDPRELHLIRRDVLTQRIFGVDRNPMAVWLCELRLWLSIVIECPEARITRIPPLPNLDHHIRLGDSLASGDFRFAAPAARRLTRLRERYARATGTRKRTLATALDHEERQRALVECERTAAVVRRDRIDLVDTLRTRDLFGERRRRTRADAERLDALRRRARELAAHHRRLSLGGALPFRFASQFADVAAAGGFPLIVGNPPWVRPHALPAVERTRLRAEYHTMRHAAWRTGARRAGAGAGFAAQADISTAFIERSTQLLAPGGVAALLVPAKLWRALAGGGVRDWLSAHTHIRCIRDWSDAPALFDAAVYPSAVVVERRDDVAHTTASAATQPPIAVSVARRDTTARFTVQPTALSLAGDSAAPWLLFPEEVLRAFNALRDAGPALGDSPLGRPLLGVKCGLNAAFLVTAVEHDDDSATIEADGRRAIIERHVLRPVLRGDAVSPPPTDHAAPRSRDLHIIWTHDHTGAPLRTLPPATARWLAHWRSSLERRRDARPQQPWWSLYRTDAARADCARVVWADIGKQLRPCVLAPGDPTVPLNSCYVMRAANLDDAYALHTLLSSPIAAAWFHALAEPARGGFRRFMGWTVATLPLPARWLALRETLAAFSRSHDHQAPNTEARALAHTQLVADAYNVSLRTLQPLLHWTAS